jgi:hypothetical protein
MATVSSVTTKTGTTEVEPPIKDDCKELAQANDDARHDLWWKTDDQSLMGENVKVSDQLSFPNGSQSGTTVSSMAVGSPGGESIWTFTAHSSQKAYEKFPGTFESGGGEAVRSGNAPTLCGYTHPPPAQQKSGHAEARLFDTLGSTWTTPVKMTFNIDWRPNQGAPSKMPCKTCHAMMCAAKKCDHQISLCKADGKQVELSKEHCPVTKATRRRLKKDMAVKRKIQGIMRTVS